MAGPCRRAGLREQRCLRLQRSAESAQQRGAPIETNERVVPADLEHLGECISIERDERIGVDPARLARVGRKAPGKKSAKARDPKPFGPCEALPARRFGIAPVGASARIEQHADECQIDACTRTLCVAAAGKCHVELARAVHAAGFEVAPAAVVRNAAPRKALARERRHAVGNNRKLARVERELLRIAGRHRIGDVAATLADRRGVTQRGNRIGNGVVRQARALSLRRALLRSSPCRR